MVASDYGFDHSLSSVIESWLAKMQQQAWNFGQSGNLGQKAHLWYQMLQLTTPPSITKLIKD